MKSPRPGNPIVYFDFQVGQEHVGRMVIELRKDVVPKTAENFRRLCVGDFTSKALNAPLTYAGTLIHSVKRIFAICGGKIGRVGESIYGPTFEDENFELTHETGALSMANFGPNTNNSQFFITRTECPNLDGTNVVVGQVLRGIDIIEEMERVSTDEGAPTVDIVIVNSGELDADESLWGYYDSDDNLPPFPNDWHESSDFDLDTTEPSLQLLERMKALGNHLYGEKDFAGALRKYKKVGRYHHWFVDKTTAMDSSDVQESFNMLRHTNLLNMAACQIKLGQFTEVLAACNEVLKPQPKEPSPASKSKAFYRRGVASTELKDYDQALADLQQAYSLAPNDPHIQEQFELCKGLWLEYRKTERAISEKMFKSVTL